VLPHVYVAFHVVIRNHANTTAFHIDSEFIVIPMYTFDGAETSRVDIGV